MIELNKVTGEESINVGDLVQDDYTDDIGIVIKQDFNNTSIIYNVLILDTINEEHSLVYLESKTLYAISKDFTVVQKKNNYKLNIEY